MDSLFSISFNLICQYTAKSIQVECNHVFLFHVMFFFAYCALEASL